MNDTLTKYFSVQSRPNTTLGL